MSLPFLWDGVYVPGLICSYLELSATLERTLEELEGHLKTSMHGMDGTRSIDVKLKWQASSMACLSMLDWHSPKPDLDKVASRIWPVSQ